jgi:hypothetical protein
MRKATVRTGRGGNTLATRCTVVSSPRLMHTMYKAMCQTGNGVL